MIFRFDDQRSRLGIPYPGVARRLRKLLDKGFEIYVMQPRGGLIKIPLNFLLAHFRHYQVPPLPVLRVWNRDADRALYISTATFHYRLGNWRGLMARVRRLTV